MNGRMLASDYDGTLAEQGAIAPPTEQALRDLKQIGWLLGLVTGRTLDSLRRVCPQLGLFNTVVAENGAVLYTPDDDQLEPLAAAPSPDLIIALKRQNISFYVGQVLVGIQRPDEAAVSAIIQTLGLDLRIVGNKDAAMILPTHINKATGLALALKRMSIPAEHVVGIGDAENDIELFQATGFRVAVANALDSLKQMADHVTHQPGGAGVTEYIREQLRSS